MKKLDWLVFGIGLGILIQMYFPSSPMSSDNDVYRCSKFVDEFDTHSIMHYQYEHILFHESSHLMTYPYQYQIDIDSLWREYIDVNLDMYTE